MTNTLSTTTLINKTLDTDILERFRARAGELDRTNGYFFDDLADLRSVDYLATAVAIHHGGWGLSLGELNGRGTPMHSSVRTIVVFRAAD